MKGKRKLARAQALRAFLNGAASVLDLGASAPLPRYRGFDADAAALRGDQRAIGKDFRKAARSAV